MKIFDAFRIVGQIVLIIAAVECVIMLLLGSAGWSLTTLETAILDTMMLVLFSTPLIYYWVIMPFIVARDEALDEVHRLATSDPLTKLPNRRMLDAYLGKMLASTQRYHHYAAVMLLDLNEFKPVNDSHGHDVGDVVLQQVAERLARTNRLEDMVSRLGGDEFVIIISHLDDDLATARGKAITIAEKISNDIAEPIEHNDLVLSIGCAIGIRIMDGRDTTADQVLREADMGMYAAKEGKESYVIYEPKAEQEADRGSFTSLAF